jgi:hypothetical protein
MISIIIPTIRPQNIPDLLEAIKKACTKHEYEVIWEEDEKLIGAPEMVKKLVKKTKYEFVVFLGDDTIPQEHCIDNAVGMAFRTDKALIGFNDGHGQKATHWLAHKRLLEHLDDGEFFYTGYIHNFCDDELRVRAVKLETYAWCVDALILHNHPAFDPTIPKDTYEVQMNKENWEHDKNLFYKRNS